jgi:hypothetical protein
MRGRIRDDVSRAASKKKYCLGVPKRPTRFKMFDIKLNIGGLDDSMVGDLETPKKTLLSFSTSRKIDGKSTVLPD